MEHKDFLLRLASKERTKVKRDVLLFSSEEDIKILLLTLYKIVSGTIPLKRSQFDNLKRKKVLQHLRIVYIIRLT